jgi:cytoskeletal protein RodZ
MGCHLTTLFGSTDITAVSPIDAPATRKKLGWLPLLTALFCLSYALMTMLIVEQGATIESQRALIRELFRDSTELSASKFKAMQDQRAAQAKSQASAKSPLTQTPSTQNPSTQAQSNQAPSSQAVPQNRAQNQSQKPNEQFQMPPQPASDLADDRRALIKI